MTVPCLPGNAALVHTIFWSDQVRAGTVQTARVEKCSDRACWSSGTRSRVAHDRGGRSADMVRGGGAAGVCRQERRPGGRLHQHRRLAATGLRRGRASDQGPPGQHHRPATGVEPEDPGRRGPDRDGSHRRPGDLSRRTPEAERPERRLRERATIQESMAHRTVIMRVRQTLPQRGPGFKSQLL